MGESERRSGRSARDARVIVLPPALPGHVHRCRATSAPRVGHKRTRPGPSHALAAPARQHTRTCRTPGRTCTGSTCRAAAARACARGGCGSLSRWCELHASFSVRRSLHGHPKRWRRAAGPKAPNRVVSTAASILHRPPPSALCKPASERTKEDKREKPRAKAWQAPSKWTEVEQLVHRPHPMMTWSRSRLWLFSRRTRTLFVSGSVLAIRSMHFPPCPGSGWA